MGLLSPTLTVENLKLHNTAEFGGSPLADVPELHLEYDRGALAFRKLRFKLVRLQLRELNIVESKAGRTNIIGFVHELQQLSSPNANSRSAFTFAGIDVLNLTLDNVRYSNLKHPSQGYEFQVGLKNELLTNIKALPDLSNLILNLLLNRGITITSRGDRTSITVNPKGSSREDAGQARPGPAPATGKTSRTRQDSIGP